MERSVARRPKLILIQLDKLYITPIRPKPNTPTNIIIKTIVNINLSFAVILCSSLIIKKRSVAAAPQTFPILT